MKTILYDIMALLLLFSLCSFFAPNAWADTIASGTCGAQGDNLTWTLDDSGSLIIDGTGEMANYSEATAPWYRNRLSITSVTIQNGVNSIGNYAFYYCDKLLSINIPKGILTIGNHSFDNCLMLEEVIIPESTIDIGGWAFRQCRNLKKVTLAEGVINVGTWSFYGCSNLSNVMIPSSVENIGSSAFLACRGLTEILVNPNNAYYYDNDGVLFNKSEKSLLCYPQGRTDTEYYIPIGVEKIENNAFHGSFYLSNVIIPNGVTSIGGGVFQGCTNLASVTIPKSVEIINQYAFSVCRSLTQVFYNGTIEEWNNIIIKAQNDSLISATIHYIVPDFVLPAELLMIHDEAFVGGIFIYVKLSDKTTSIGNRAFANCPNLRYIFIPDGAKINENAFDGITELTIIGVSDKDIESYALRHGFKYLSIS